MNNKQISLIIPVYNTSKYIRKCIQSLLDQTFKDFEIICVDDGSTDNSVEIIKELRQKDKRVILLEEQHKGVGNARNQGAKLANGKYIQFLDSDDFFEPTMLEEMYNIAERQEADIVVCSAQKVDENNKIIGKSIFWPINSNLAICDKPICSKEHPEIINMFAPEPWASLYNREFFNKNNLKFPDLSSSNGACLGLISRVLADKVFIINKPFINYRYFRMNSISSKKDIFNMIRERLHFKELLIENNLYKNLEKIYHIHFTNRIKYLVSLCKNNEEYINFTKKFQELFPDEYEEYRNTIEQQKNTYETLKTACQKEKVAFWGASLFLERFLQENLQNNENIVGIIDKDKNKQGQKFGKYEIFSPEVLKTKDIKTILFTILNNNEVIYQEVKDFLSKNYPNIELLPNIFIQ